MKTNSQRYLFLTINLKQAEQLYMTGDNSLWQTRNPFNDLIY